MKIINTLILLLAMTASSCNGRLNRNTTRNDVELIKVPVAVGLGTLDISFDLPVPLYRSENDEMPIDTLTFRYDKEGVWHYETHLKSFNPYIMFSGNSYEESRENINIGLICFPSVLAFRVMEESDCCYRVVVDESSFETVVIRKNPDYAVLTNRDLFGVNMPKDKAYKGYYIYETWEHLLLRAEFVGFHSNYAVYDTPNGKKIFENTNGKFLPYKVVKVQGDWMKVKKGFGREFNFEGIANAEGWVRWKTDTAILVDITEYMID